MSNRIDDLFNEMMAFTKHLFDLRDSAKHASFDESRKPQHWQIGTPTKSESSTAPSEFSTLGDGKAQPVCKLLDESADLAEEYSKPSGCVTEAISLEYQKFFSPVSEREFNRKENLSRTISELPEPAPNSLSTIVNTECEQILETNRHGDLICKAEAVGICKHCELLLCQECAKYSCCTDTRNSLHEVTRL